MLSGAGSVGLACAEPSGGGPVIGLALGSGAARGWAHLGVLLELAREGVVPQIITGCSIGAFVGAAAASGDLDKLVRWAETLKWQDVVSLLDVSLRGGLIKGQKLIDFFERNFVDRDFTELDQRFACVATELSTGREIWLHEGSVSAAVRASIALPGLMTPVLHQGRMLVDGGLVNPVPVSLCRALGADIVIAVDLSMDTIGLRQRRGDASAWRQTMGRWLGREGDGDGEDVARPSLADVVSNSIAIMQGRISRSRLAGEPADVLIAPRLGQLGLLDFHRAHEAIAAGRMAAEHMLPMLRAIIE